jgi:putative heme utilization carrier protein HutX
MASLTAPNELAELVAEQLKQNPRAMTRHLAEALGVPEADVIRWLPEGRSIELNPERRLELIQRFEALGKVHVIVSNGATVLECFGQFGHFSTTGAYFNVQTASLDMHINHEKLGAVFAVRKKGHMDGHETLSFQFFAKDGQAAFKVFMSFGGKGPPPEIEQRFADLVREFRL